MKKIYLKMFVAIFILASTTLSAQVGIGTPTPFGALDITSPNDGLLIPRIALTNTATATVLTPTISELVYNTASVNDVTPGFYYWNGTIWVRLSTGLPTSDWSLTGNAGTTPGTNFLGTTTNVDLRIKTNNADRFDFTNNGRLRAYDNGTVALPTYSWNGDNGTGFWRPAANTLAFSTNATEKLRIEPDGDVGIGATPNVSAKLHISATDRGLLIPNVILTATNVAAPITTPATSLLVYNTNTTAGATGVSPGYYYWNGSWIRMATGVPTNDWALTGNAGTSAATNYIGTSDGVPVRVSTAATERMRILANGQIVVNNTAAPFTNDRFSVYNTTVTDRAIAAYSTSTGIGIVGQNVGSGRGVQGVNSGTGRGVIGFSDTTGYGVAGQNSGTGIGVAGFGVTTGIGVYGQNTAGGAGIQAVNTSIGDGLQVFQTGSGDGIYNQAAGGNGIYNYLLSNQIGIINDLTASGGTGELIDTGTNNGVGIEVDSQSGNVFSFFGDINTTTASTTVVNGAVLAGIQAGRGHGVLINHTGASGRNAEFNVNGTTNADAAVFVSHLGTGSAMVVQNQGNVIPGAPITVGDFAYTGTDVDDHIAVAGYSAPAASFGIGVQGSGNFTGVVGEGGDYGVASIGDFIATGAKFFMIDHPADPANKFLKHANIESNEILNFYRGTAVFDATGKATVTLPTYYDQINKNASYQLTPVGAAMPNLFVEQEIANGVFVIAGGVPNKKVSWNVTAERNDAYLQQHPEKRNMEVDKGPRKGKYLNPDLYNQPAEKGVFYKKHETLKPTSVSPSDRKTKKSSANRKPAAAVAEEAKVLENEQTEK